MESKSLEQIVFKKKSDLTGGKSISDTLEARWGLWDVAFSWFTSVHFFDA